jgi:hypothetical protein
VTRVSVTTARCGARSVAGPLVGGLFALLLAGCETSGTASSEASAGAALAQQQVQTKPVAFAPVIGAPAKVSTKLNEMLVASAGQKSIPVVPPKDAEYTIRGYLVAAPDPKGTKLSYIWDVSDKANKRKRIQGEELIEGKKGGDPWTAVDENAMQRVAVKAIDEIGAYLPKAGTASEGAPANDSGAATASVTPAAAPAAASPTYGAASLNSNDAPPDPPATRRAAAPAPAPTQVAAAPAPQASTPPAVSTSGGGTVLAAQTEQPAPPAEAIAIVPPVSGAPGDGSQSLTAAMRRHLQSAGV